MIRCSTAAFVGPLTGPCTTSDAHGRSPSILLKPCLICRHLPPAALAANEFTSSDWSQPFNATAGPTPTLGEMVLSIR